MRTDEQRAFHRSQAAYHWQRAEAHRRATGPANIAAELRHELAARAHEEAAGDPNDKRLTRAAMRASSQADQATQQAARPS